MAKKKCATCGVTKPDTADHFRIYIETGKLSATCRACRAARHKEVRSSPEVRSRLAKLQKVRDERKAEAKRKLKKDPGPQPEGKTIPDSKVYVVTYAQNATPVHKPFLDALLNYCAANNAELVVIGGRYKNPTSIFSKKMEHDEWWSRDIHPWLFRGRRTLGKHLTIFGDISIQPTATRPLTDFEVFSGPCSAIFGHPKIQLKTVATAKRRYPRILTTTGAVTKANYTDSKAGKKAEAHHIFGATVVEQGENLFHIRQINALADGSFIDLETRYTASGTEAAPPPLALVCGDIHVDFADQEVLNATFRAADSILETLRPKKLILHDVLHFATRNHHTINDPTDKYARAHGLAQDVVKTEVEEAVEFLDSFPEWVQPIVIASNHDEAFDRWLNEANPKHDPVNALFWHETWARKLRAFHRDGHFSPAFKLVYKAIGQRRAKFWDREEPLLVGGSYVNFHGDHGIDGARGSIQQYARLGAKTVIGHRHSPGILDGCYQAGVTGDLDQGYNRLPSSWLNTHCLIYANSKRTLIHVIDGAWRG